MRKSFFYALLLIFCTVSAFAQAPDTLWTAVFGGPNGEVGYNTQPTSDGGYILLAHTESYGAGGQDVYLIKLNSSGGSVWTQTYGGSMDEQAYDVYQTTDGGYIFGGRTESFGQGEDDFWIVKTDASGTEEWSRTYGGSMEDEGYSLTECSDGGYLIAGDTETFAANDVDVWMIKLDANGDSLWSRTFDYGGEETANYVEQTADGGYILIGYSDSFSANLMDVLILKTDASGNEEWHNYFGTEFLNTSFSGHQTSDGGYIIAGYVFYMTNSTDGLIIKTDSDGNEEWSNLYGGDGWDTIYGILETDEGNYIAAGYTSTYGAGVTDIYLLGLDSNGTEEWYTTFGGDSAESSVSMTALEDGFIITGNTQSWGGGGQDIYVLRFGEGTFADYSENVTPVGFKFDAPYPNPFNPTTELRFELQDDNYVSFCVFDVEGKQVATLNDGFLPAGRHEFTFDAADLSSGMYFAKLTAGDFTQTRKLLLIK